MKNYSGYIFLLFSWKMRSQQHSPSDEHRPFKLNAVNSKGLPASPQKSKERQPMRKEWKWCYAASAAAVDTVQDSEHSRGAVHVLSSMYFHLHAGGTNGSSIASLAGSLPWSHLASKTHPLTLPTPAYVILLEYFMLRVRQSPRQNKNVTKSWS